MKLQLKGSWNEVKGKLKQKYAQLTDDDLTYVAGHRDQLVGRLQERYGIARDEAEKQVKDWEG